MATYHDAITEAQADLIRRAPVFFIATVDPEFENGPDGVGPINLSPKGSSPLHIISDREVAYLDFRGSGNETARHTAQGSPITVMTCSFDSDAAIVRLYGRATITALEESPHAARFLDGGTSSILKNRQVISVQIESTMTSCGYGVPIMDLVRQRSKEDRGRRFKAV